MLYDGLVLPPVPRATDRLEARKRLGLSAVKRLVLFAGQIIVRKGVADLLHAWARLPAESRDGADLLIVGEDLEGQGAYRAAMEKLAAELAVAARFTGFQKNVPDWLLAADIAVVPSHVEPLGNATLEAMSFALPVIGGNVGGIPEMIVHEETGLLVPPGDPTRLAEALGTLLADAERCRRFGAAGRERCEAKFSLVAQTDALLGEYDRALAARNGASTACRLS